MQTPFRFSISQIIWFFCTFIIQYHNHNILTLIEDKVNDMKPTFSNLIEEWDKLTIPMSRLHISFLIYYTNGVIDS